VVLPVKIGPTLPARGAADVLRCRPVNSRPVADVPARGADLADLAEVPRVPAMPARSSGL
jgi:hypothetical protein